MDQPNIPRNHIGSQRLNEKVGADTNEGPLSNPFSGSMPHLYDSPLAIGMYANTATLNGTCYGTSIDTRIGSYRSVWTS